MKKAAFLILTFLSSLGDSLFLAGMPLYFYSETNTILSTFIVPVVITLTILASRSLHTKFQNVSPIKLVAFGELGMFVIELIQILFYNVYRSNFVIIAGLIPLAVVYNCYSSAKFVSLIRFFDKENDPKYSASHSWMLRVGALLGALLSGFLIERHGVLGLLWGDALSFLILGLFLVLLTKFDARTLTSQMQSQQPISQPGIQESFSENSRNEIFIVLSLAAILISSLFLTWERSSGTSLYISARNGSLSNATQLRTLCSFAGIMVGFYLISRGFQHLNKYWIGSLVFAPCLLLLIYPMNVELAFSCFFFASGFSGIVQVPAVRATYDWLSNSASYPSNFSNRFWPVSGMLGISLIPVGLLSDSLAGYGIPKSVSAPVLFYVLVGAASLIIAIATHRRVKVR